nr:hypothetical protein [Saccharothrix syringae]
MFACFSTMFGPGPAMDGLGCQVPAWCARSPGGAAVEQSDPGGVAAEDESEFVDQTCGLVQVWVVGDARGGEVCGDAGEQLVLAQVEVARRALRSGTGAGVTVTATVRGPAVGTVRVHLPPTHPTLKSARQQVNALAVVGVGMAGAVPGGLDGLGGDEVLLGHQRNVGDAGRDRPGVLFVGWARTAR